MSNRTIPDKVLVLSAQKGELSSFNILVDRYQNSVQSAIRPYLHDLDEVNDVTQDAFVRAFQKLSTFHSPYNFSAWVIQIAQNIARNRCMRRQKTVPLEEIENKVAQDPSENVENKKDIKKRVKQVVEALSKLSPPLRETARLAYLSGYSQSEIKKKLRIPAGTVKRRLWEGRKNIRKEVRKMSRKGKESEVFSIVPKIQISEIPDISMHVQVRGYGSYFGSILEVGDVEVNKFYDYPGGILTQTVRSEVMRKVTLLDREFFEVLITHSDCEPPEPNVLNYFEVGEDEIRWFLMITADETYPRLDTKGIEEEIAPSFYSTNDPNSNYRTCVIHLKIDKRDYVQCLSVIEGWQDGTPCQRVYTKEGRQVLHRRYVGPNAPQSSNYDYEKLPDGPNLIIGNIQYRLWYDTILIEPY